VKYGKAKDEYSTPKPNGALNQLWNESPNLIKKYFNEYPNYQQLCGEGGRWCGEGGRWFKNNLSVFILFLL